MENGDTVGNNISEDNFSILPVPAGFEVTIHGKVLVAIHYSVLDARNGYIRNVVV